MVDLRLVNSEVEIVVSDTGQVSVQTSCPSSLIDSGKRIAPQRDSTAGLGLGPRHRTDIWWRSMAAPFQPEVAAPARELQFVRVALVVRSLLIVRYIAGNRDCRRSRTRGTLEVAGDIVWLARADR
jgi:hypothetical protein